MCYVIYLKLSSISVTTCQKKHNYVIAKAGRIYGINFMLTRNMILGDHKKINYNKLRFE